MRHLRFLALTLTLALLMAPVSLAEELGEMDLYAPEVYGGEFVEEAPAAEAEEAGQAPAESEAPEFVLKAGEPTIALTEKKVSVQMNVGDALQIVVNAGETGKFKSKNKKYAAVDATGLVTALAKGSAKIEFKPSGGKTRTLSIKILDPYEPTGVSVAQGKTVALNVGDVLQLDALLAPDTARTTLTWKSDKSKVASVDAAGVVTAKSEGKTKLTVTTANKKKATLAVTVTDPYKPTGVSIAQGSAIVMNVGDALQLDAQLAPDTARTTLTWKSSKAKVASVDAAGIVTAKAEGKAKLTVTTANKKKATLVVTVVDINKPTGISIVQGNALTLTVGESAQLDAALIPETSRATIRWSSSKANVAAVDAAGRVTALAPGDTMIIVTTDNKLSAALALQVIRSGAEPLGPAPGGSAMTTATYNGVSFKVVNTPIDPFTYADLVYDNVCTHPGGTDRYEGYCLCFANFYVSGMVDNKSDADPSVAKKKYRTSKQLSYKTEKYSDPNEMMARLYDLLSAGVPQILMVEALLHKGSRHFVTVVGYRASVTRREALRPEDLLIIDSYDGKLESMDPAVEPADVRHLFKQSGKYRIEAAKYRD